MQRLLTIINIIITVILICTDVQCYTNSISGVSHLLNVHVILSIVVLYLYMYELKFCGNFVRKMELNECI